jgi:superfamily II DNA or RNA helicase
MASISHLMPHQVELIEEYRASSAPRIVVLDAPVGSGKSVTLAAIAASRADLGDLVLMVMPRLLVSQATDLVVGFGEIFPTVYSATADFRLALGEKASPWPDSGVVICSTSVITSPVAIKALRRVSPSLLIVDDVWASRNSNLARSLGALAEQSAKVLITGGDEQYWPISATNRQWAFPLVDSEGHLGRPEFSVRVHDYPGDPAEAKLVLRARALLERFPSRVARQSSTRVAIQNDLLRVVQRLEDPDRLATANREERAESARQDVVDRQVIESMWRVLDDFDNLPQDERLIAVVEEARTAFEAMRPVLIVTDLVKEADYIAAAVQTYGLSFDTITMSISREARVSALADMQNGRALIVTAPVLAEAQRPLPDRTRSLWFAAPTNRRQAQRQLGVGISSRDIEVVLFRALPPVTPGDERIGLLAEILRNA